MSFPLFRPLRAWCCLLAACAQPAWAANNDWTISGDPGHWRLVGSPYSLHYRYSVEHKPVWALGLERQRDDGWLAGASYFRNSFGQPSGYAYVGARYSGILGQPQLFTQWSAGVLYGYVGKFKTKVPLNVGGFAPGALVSAGWQLTPSASASVHLLGDAGLMLQFAFELP